MIAPSRIDQIATEIATRFLGKRSVVRVSNRPYVDYRGSDALRIEIVLSADAVASIKGEAVVQTLSGIRSRLDEDGEDRFLS